MQLSGVAPQPPCRLYSHVIARGSLSSFPLNSERLFSQYVWHRFHRGNVFRITFGIRSFRPIVNSMLTAKKGHSIPISEGSYDTVWILETDLDAGLLPYLTGDLPELGGWQPKMAVQMLPTEDARLWKAEVKTPSGVNFKYNYFIVDETRAPSDISWRPGPEYSLSVPLKDEADQKILVKDSWMKRSPERSIANVWGSWTEEMHLMEPSTSCDAQDRNEITEVLELEESGRLQSDLNVQASLVLWDRDQPVEEPWLPAIFIRSENEQITGLASKCDFVKNAEVRSIIDNQDPIGKDSNVPVEENSQTSKDLTPSTTMLINSLTCTMQSDLNVQASLVLCDRDQPVEEPWLPTIFIRSENEQITGLASKCDFVKDAEVRSIIDNQDSMGKDSNVPVKENSQTSKDLTPSTTMLINSPTCTMQSDLNVQASLVLCDRDQPVEEPWLPTIFIRSEKEQITELASEGDFVKDVEVRLIVDNQDSIGKDRNVPIKENSQISKHLSPVTTMLISSSTGIMQRIAVLEDGELVELLLEPVKSDVVCDSIYLGVVTKSAPRMNGAFVDIGSPNTSLMEIKHYREPFVIEPQKIKELETGDSLIKTSDYGDSFLKVFERLQSDVQITDESDISETVMSDDNEDHEDDDDLEFLSEHTNGIVLANEQYNASHVPNQHNQEDPKQMLVHNNKCKNIHEGSMIIVQVVKEELGKKGPVVTPYPRLKGRFWVLVPRQDTIAVSKEIIGAERKRLKDIAKGLQPPGFGLIVRTVAAGHSPEELKKNLEGLLMTWKDIMEKARTAASAADGGTKGAVPVMLHKAMDQTLFVVQDYFSEKVEKVVIDSPRTYHKVLNYLQDIAPDLCDRVELYDKRNPLFSEYKIEEEFNNILSKRVPLANGAYIVIEPTEALVAIDVNGGHMMMGEGISQEKACLEVNLAAAKQIARELRLRNIGGTIVVDFIDMANEANKRLVYQEMKRAVAKDRSNSMVTVSELSGGGLMEITRKRVGPSVPFKMSEPCTCCDSTGRVEALFTTLLKIEQEICRLLASRDQDADPENPETWPRFRLWVDHYMFQDIKKGTTLAILSSSLNVWLISKVNSGFSRGSFKLEPFDNATERDDIKSQSQRLQVLLQSKNSSINPKKRTNLVAVNKAKIGRRKAKTGRKAK